MHARQASVEVQVQCVNVVIGVVLGVLHVVRVVAIVVCDDAVVRRTLVFIAFHRSHCFHRRHLRRIFLYWRYCVDTSPSLTVNCCWLLPNFELYCTKLILRIIPRINGPITFQQVSLINQGWVHRRGDAQKNTTKILASSTKMRNSFVIFADELYPLGY